ncbi:MAG: CopG family transcriptional regulator [Spirochaetaceae bacterium]|nr:MAG: CopG family transcriptional regulator [Spirochaetaceae bacterium]
MPKTITIRLDDETYNLIRSAAEGQMRSIANYVEYATISHLTEEAFASDEEMEQIMSDNELVQTLKKARTDVRTKRYTVVQ